MSTIRLGGAGRAVAGLMMLGTGTALAAPQFNMPYGVTRISHDIYDLHMMMLWICVAIGIGVYGVMAYSIIHHRKSKGAVPAQFHENTTIEIIWTVIPFLILLGAAIPSTIVLGKSYHVGKPQMVVKITGYQWMWHYSYPEQNIAFYSKLAQSSDDARQLGSHVNVFKVPHYLRAVDHPLVLPIHTRIEFLITSKDVIHSWWVPDLGIKKDAIPGYINTDWTNINKPGVYRGQCAALCGRGHAYMPIVVHAVTRKQFREWVAKEQQKPQQHMLKRIED